MKKSKHKLRGVKRSQEDSKGVKSSKGESREVKRYQEEMGRVAPGMTPIRRRRTQSSQTQTPQRGNPEKEDETLTIEKYSQELISGELSQRLFAITQKLHKKLPEEIGTHQKSVFPVLPGSYLKLTNPALEFVKALCHVLNLDPVECHIQVPNLLFL